MGPTQPLLRLICEQLHIEVRDNGRVGTQLVARPGHMGLRSMQERATSIGGTVRWSRQYGGGTAVMVQAPTQAKAQREPACWRDWADAKTSNPFLTEKQHD